MLLSVSSLYLSTCLSVCLSVYLSLSVCIYLPSLFRISNNNNNNNKVNLYTAPKSSHKVPQPNGTNVFLAAFWTAADDYGHC